MDNHLQAAQSQSGKWHLLGPRGCLSVEADRIAAERVKRIRDDKRRRDWCAYCERELRIIELEQELDRERNDTVLDASVFVAPSGSRLEGVWHAESGCGRGPDSPVDWPLDKALSERLRPCKVCVMGVSQPDSQDRSHYKTLTGGGEGSA